MPAPRLKRSQSPEQAEQLVRQSIQTKQPISAVYKNCRRLLCPYLLGKNHAGRKQVLCYQFGGESRSGLEGRNSPNDWRCVALEELLEVQLIDQGWRAPSNRYQPQTCIEEIEETVAGWPVNEPR
jgi:hypothetical protein